MKRLIKCLLFVTAASILLSLLTVSAADIVDFSISSADGRYADTVRINVTADKKVSVAGFVFAFVYDTDKVSFIEGSQKFQSNIKNVTYYNNQSKGIVTFAWEDDTNVDLGTEVLSLQFKIETQNTGTANIQMQVKELYSDYLSRSDISNRVLNTGTINIYGTSPAVDNCKALIDSIGTVTLDSKPKIDAANAAYTVLSTAEKMQVTNYKILVNAINKYNELLSQNAALKTDELINEWRTQNKAALALTVETVTLKDKSIIESAVAGWQLLTNEAKTQTVSEKNRLNKLLKRIEVLEAAEKDAEKAREAEKEAQKIAEAYKETYKWLFSLTVEDITKVYSEGIEEAIKEYESIGYMNTLAQQKLAPQKEQLDLFIKRIEEIQIEKDAQNAPAIKSYYQFKDSFGYLLAMPLEQVTIDDLVDIQVALFAYSSLPSETQDRLTEEKAYLDKLLEKAQSLEKSQDSGIVDNGSGSDNSAKPESKTVIKYVEKSTDNKAASVKASPNFVMSKAIKIILISSTVPIVMFVCSASVYIIIKRKQNILEREAASNEQ